MPKAVREPIQKAKIADELTKTREQEQLTAKAQADLTEAKAKVVFEEKRTQAETEKMVAEVEAEGEKKAKEIEAMTEKLKAEIDAKSAAIEAQTTRVLGEAKAQSVKLAKEAKAERFQLLVKAMGGPESYERYIFAEGLPADLRVGHLLRRAGHPLDRPEGLRANHARQGRRGDPGRCHGHRKSTRAGRRRQQQRLRVCIEDDPCRSGGVGLGPAPPLSLHASFAHGSTRRTL